MMKLTNKIADIKMKYVAVPMKQWGLLIAEFLKVRYILFRDC